MVRQGVSARNGRANYQRTGSPRERGYWSLWCSPSMQCSCCGSSSLCYMWQSKGIRDGESHERSRHKVLPNMQCKKPAFQHIQLIVLWPINNLGRQKHSTPYTWITSFQWFQLATDPRNTKPVNWSCKALTEKEVWSHWCAQSTSYSTIPVSNKTNVIE